MLRRDSCTACTFLRNGVKTRKTIPHTCNKSNEEIMKVIKEGEKKIDKVTKRRCYRCGCVFEYVRDDINSDRNGIYVICPNEYCKSFMFVTKQMNKL